MKKHFLLTLTIIIVSYLSSVAQSTQVVSLSGVKILYTPKYFYVAKISDKRGDTSILGTVKTSNNRITTYKFPNSFSSALNACYNKSITSDTSKIPIEISIKKVELRSSRKGNKEEFEYNPHIEIFSQDNQLCSFDGHVYYNNNIPSNLHVPVETLITKSLTQILKNLDEWLNENKNNLQKRVTIKSQILLSNKDSNLLIYNPDVPLKISDFKKSITESNSGVSPICGINYEYSYETIVNNKKLKLNVIPSFNKNASWIVPDSDSESLAYAQMIFDIYALKAVEFCKIADTSSFSFDGFSSELETILMQVRKSADVVIEKFTSDVQGGYPKALQGIWRAKITDQLQKTDYFK